MRIPVLRFIFMACFMVASTSTALKGAHNTPSDEDGPPPQTPVQISLDLDATTENSQALFVHIMAIGEIPAGYTQADIDQLPQAMGIPIVQRLAGQQVTLAFENTEEKAAFEMAIAQYYTNHKMAEYTAEAIEAAQLKLITDCPTIWADFKAAHGPLSAATIQAYLGSIYTTGAALIRAHVQTMNAITTQLQQIDDNSQDTYAVGDILFTITPADQIETHVAATLLAWRSDREADDNMPPFIDPLIDAIKDSPPSFVNSLKKVLHTLYQHRVAEGVGHRYIQFLTTSPLFR